MSQPSRESCAQCDGFGYHPAGAEDGWYARDWRVLLDATVDWERCRQCSDPRSPLAALHERLSQQLLQQLDREVTAWTPIGAWRRGEGTDQQRIWRWRDVAIVPPGPITDHLHWLAVSSLGVQRGLDRDQCAVLLQRLGAPELPAEGEPL